VTQNDHASDTVKSEPLVAVAAAIRDFGHLLTSRTLRDRQLAAEIVDTLAKLAARVDALAPMERDRQVELGRMLESPAGDGEPMSAGVHCPVTGPGNPLGLAGTVVREGDTAVGRFIFRAASAGLPGVAHGGHLAAAIDGLLGLAAVHLTSTPVVTANLEIDYLAPVPVDEEVIITARVISHTGRKYVVGAAGRCAGTDVVRATSLFIAPRWAGESARP
jgi:acyl-coenzyme A thioesterase PaaI-like protein